MENEITREELIENIISNIIGITQTQPEAKIQTAQNCINELLTQSDKEKHKNIISEIYKKLSEIYEEEKAEFIRLARLNDSSFKRDTSSWLKKLKTKDDTQNYLCKVFMQDNSKKIPTPLKFPRSTLSYIGARTHRGKTTALISITLDAIEQGQKVYFATTEETEEQIYLRMVKAILYKNYKDDKNIFKYNFVKQKSDLELEDIDSFIESQLQQYEKELFDSNKAENLKEAVFRSFEKLNEYLAKENFTIIDHLQQRTFEELLNCIDSLDNGSLIVLDYIQHVKNPINCGINTRQIIIQNESQQLADLAAKKDLIIIAGGQFNRKGSSVEKDDDKYKPDLLDASLFRESGDIEQDAHLIIGIGQVLHENANEVGENVTRFYEVLKQRGHAPDEKQYKIIDCSKYSLFNCEIRQSENGNDKLQYFIKPKKTKEFTKEQTQTKQDKLKNLFR